MPVSETLVIAILFFVGAALYASVGHGGASSYLAVMGLFSFAPDVMKPTALALNILVAAIATVKFYRAGLFKWNLFWPFAIASIPAAYVGGATALPARQSLRGFFGKLWHRSWKTSPKTSVSRWAGDKDPCVFRHLHLRLRHWRALFECAPNNDGLPSQALSR